MNARYSLEPLDVRRLLSAGDPVDSFGVGGVAAFNRALGKQIPSDLVPLSNGKILVAIALDDPENSSNVAPADFVQFNADGTPDTSFGPSNKGFVESFYYSVQSVTPLSNGNFLALGTVFDKAEHSYVARFLQNGTLDTTFGNDGRIELSDYGTLGGEAQFSRIYADGSVIAAFGPNIVRFNSDGSLDTSYGPGGKVIAKSLSVSAVVFGDAYQTYILGSRTNGSTVHNVVRKLNAQGSIDTTFSTGGEVELDRKLSLGVIAADQNGFAVTGAIPFGGTNIGETAEVIQLTSAGQFDSAFGTDGVASEQLWGTQDVANIIVQQADGKLVTSEDYDGPGREYLRSDPISGRTVRYNTDGTRDLAFGELRVSSNSTTLLGTTFDGTHLLMVNESRVTELAETNDSPPTAAVTHSGTLVLNGGAGSDELSIPVLEAFYKYPTDLETIGYRATRDAWSRLIQITGVKRIVINGSGGDDVVISPMTNRPVTLNGDSGDDILRVGQNEPVETKNDAVLNGGAGNDIITFFGNDIHANGDQGNDVITGNFVNGAPNYLYGGAGNDTLLTTGPKGTFGSYLFGDEGDDTLTSGHSIDKIVGGPGLDVLNGDAAMDLIYQNDD